MTSFGELMEGAALQVSDNFVDQVDLWARGEFIQVPFELDKVRAGFAHRTDFAAQAR